MGNNYHLTIMKSNFFLKENDETWKHETSMYQIIPIKTRYIMPNEPYDMIVENATDLIEEGDFLVISETPISISQGRLVDEEEFKPSLTSIFLADIWSKYIWGYILGPLLGIKRRTIQNLRNLPPEARTHKEVILKYYGLKHALKPASEAGIDLSNAPGTYVSLLPDAPQKVAEEIAHEILSRGNKKAVVMIIDTDATYKLGKMKFTSIPVAAEGIKSDLGVFGYLLGRFGELVGPTPLAISEPQNINEMIKIAKIADDYHKKNKHSMETVYDMKNAFDTDITKITIEMLDSVEHTPAVIIRKF
jgi:F420-0:gamma-glutamyl ligase-like protein